MWNFLKDKKFQIAFLLDGLIMGVGANYIWSRCLDLSCTVDVIDNYLSTIGIGGLFLALYGFFFLFLPTHYFTRWFKYIFSWAFPLTVYLTCITIGSSSVPAYGKVDVVRFWGIVFAGITLLFVLYRYFRMRNIK